MKKVFLAYAFRDDDRDLVTYVEHLLASHDILAVTGEAVGGGAITPAVRARIEACDGLIALLTRRDQLVNGSWTTHDWVQYELSRARDAGTPCVGLFEQGVPTKGPYADHERIEFDRGDLVSALLALSRTIGVWKRDAGRTVKVQLLPDEVAQVAGGGDVTCRYRFVNGGDFAEWRDAIPVPETGGTFVFVRGAHDEHMIQIDIGHGGSGWRSRVTSQFVPVNLVQRGAH